MSGSWTASAPHERDVASTIRRLEGRLARERAARAEAERIAESGLRTLYEQQRRLRTVHTITTLASQGIVLSELLTRALEAVREHTGWSLGFVHFLPGTVAVDYSLRTHLSGCSHTHPLACDRLYDVLAEESGAAAQTWLAALEEEEHTASVPTLQWASEAGLPLLLSIPMKVGEYVVGYVGFFVPTTHIDAELLEIVRHTAAILSQAYERHAAQQALQQSEEQYRSIFDHASDAIFILEGGSGRFIKCNGAYGSFLGYSVDELLTMSILDVSDLTLGELQGVEDRIRRDKSADLGERMHRHRSGHYIPFEVSASHVALGGSELFVIVARDVSERKRYEEGLIEAKERAESFSRLQGQFLSNMSHEFRTPLAGILGCAEVLATEVSSDLHEFVAMIDESGRRLMQTLQGVLDLSDLENEVDRAAPSMHRLRSVAHGAVRRHFAAAVAKGLRLDLDAPSPSGDVAVYTDERLLSRILDHLIHNAIRFTPSGTVRLRVDVSEGEACLSVIDTGVGIHEAFLVNAFEPFTQEDTQHARQHEGAGIGLALVQRTAEVLGARVTVQSVVGEGSAFTVCLPTNRPPHFESTAHV